MSSQFEFLGNTAIGQYIPRDSWFHRRDPRARLLSLTILFIGVIFAPTLGSLGFGLGIILLIYAFSQLPLKPAWNGVKRALIFILILAILQIFLFQTSDPGETLWIVFGFEVTEAAVMSTATLILKFIVLIALINVLVMSLSTSQITTALFHLLKPLEKLGFPVNDLTMVVQVTLRYLPLIAQIAEKTAKAQASRGGDWEQRGFNPIRQAKRVLPLIVPLIVTSLKRAETMALAMESRGFNAAEQRSSFYELQFTWQDSLLLTLLTSFSILIVLSRWIF
jgi:energy-coupling factor transport system permease protein